MNNYNKYLALINSTVWIAVCEDGPKLDELLAATKKSTAIVNLMILKRPYDIAYLGKNGYEVNFHDFKAQISNYILDQQDIDPITSAKDCVYINGLDFFPNTYDSLNISQKAIIKHKLRNLYDHKYNAVIMQGTEEEIGRFFFNYLVPATPLLQDTASIPTDFLGQYRDLINSHDISKDTPYGDPLDDFFSDLFNDCFGNSDDDSKDDPYEADPYDDSFVNLQDDSQELSLDKLVGLKPLKDSFEELAKTAKFYKLAREKGKKIKNSGLHMLFTGNPGTGKTTVARLVAKLLYDMGIIRENKLKEISRKDVCGNGNWGEAEKETESAINDALDGVLFIDEAYTLINSESPKDPGRAALEIIMQAMETYKDRLVVILAGYKKEMEKLIKLNDGIASRICFTFDFPDYSSEELKEICCNSIKEQGFNIITEAEEMLTDTFKVFAGRKNLGNARFANKVTELIIRQHGTRIVTNKIEDSEAFDSITLEDIPEIDRIVSLLSDSDNFYSYKNVDCKAIRDEEKKNPLAFMNEINQLVGLNSIKTTILDFYRYIQTQQAYEDISGKTDFGNLHMLFLGNPGTGKTTVARIIAKLLYKVGLTRYDIFVESTAHNFIGDFSNTIEKTNNEIQKAIGGVLFIDEAYSLASCGSLGQMAIDTLVKAMSDYKGELIVILAGYNLEMQNFLQTNSGLKSRIGYTFNFEDYTYEELVEIFIRKMKKEGFSLDDDTATYAATENSPLKKLIFIMHYFAGCQDLGNGRFVDNLYAMVKRKHFLRIFNLGLKQDTSDTAYKYITYEDIPEINELISILPAGARFTDPSTLTEEDILSSSYHEMGHAIVSVIVKQKIINRISTVPIAQGALAYVSYQPTKKGIEFSEYTSIVDEICICMAGIAAEDAILDIKSAGGSSDLSRARMLAEHLIKSGISKLGFAYIPDYEGNIKDTPDYHAEIANILKEQYNRAKRIIIENQATVKDIAELAASKGLLEREEIRKEFEKHHIYYPEEQ